MARYKVSITVFKDAEGKTMKGITFLHFLGDLCQGFGLMLLLGGIAWLMDGMVTPGKAVVLAACVIGCLVGGSLIHKRARGKAEMRYLESLAQAGKTTKEVERL